MKKNQSENSDSLELENEKDKTINPKHIQAKSSKSINIKWSLKVLFLSLTLSIMFSVVSEMVLSTANIIIAIIVIIMLILIGIGFDMIGVAITSGDIKPFSAMASRKVKGAKESISLIKNAEKVSSFCCDIVGDICGILCGAAGAAIVVKLVSESANPAMAVLVSSLVSGIIAALTIFGKSLGKGIAVNKSEQIIHIVGKFLNIFTRKK